MIPGTGEVWDSMGKVVFMWAIFRTRRTTIRRWMLGGSCVAGHEALAGVNKV